MTKSTLLLLVFYDPGRKRDRVLVASLIKHYPEDCVAVFAVPSEAREICQSFQVVEPFPTVVLKQGGVEVTRLDRDVTLENVKQSVSPFLTADMKLRRSEWALDHADDDHQDGKEEEEEDTIKVSVKKNALERFWMTHPSLLSISGVKTTHFTISQIVRLYADFVIALRETSSSSSSSDEITKQEDEEAAEEKEERILKDHFEDMTRQNNDEYLRHSSDLTNRIHQSSSLLMQMIPLTIFATKKKKKKQLSNYALELEHVTYVTMMRELFKSTSGLLGEKVEKRHNFESKVFTSLRWFLSLASTRGCQIHLCKPSMMKLLFKLGLEITGDDVRVLNISNSFPSHTSILKNTDTSLWTCLETRNTSPSCDTSKDICERNIQRTLRSMSKTC